jgi:hypothetical protein
MSYLSCKENTGITETRKVSLVMACSSWYNIISHFPILSRRDIITMQIIIS